MKTALLVLLISLGQFCQAQVDERISTLDFVRVLNGNKEEAEYYYQNNWRVHREKALTRGMIHSYEVLETIPSEKTPYHLILITTYANKEQFDAREDNFGRLIEEKGGLSLLNDKQPADFREIPFNNGEVRHWDKSK